MPFKKTLTTIIFILVLIGGLVFNLNKTFSYSGMPTHYHLAKEMVELYNLAYDPDITPTQLERILKGSLDEDTPPRYAFHLYDPIYNRAPFSELGVHTAKQWALNYNIQALSKIGFASVIYKFFSGDFNYHGNYSWPAAVNYAASGDYDQAYYGLGHILHLIGDMSVPAHSRDDPHLPGNLDPFESWTATIDYSSDYNANLAENLYKNKILPKQIYTIGQAFDELALYSNQHFFSLDSLPQTDLSKDYYNPVVVLEKKDDFGSNSQRIYAWGRLDGGLIKLAIVKTYLVDGKKEYFIDENDDSLQTDYWTHLAPKAVQYGAAVVKLFLDQIGIDTTLTNPADFTGRLPLIADAVQPQPSQGEVKGASTENPEQPGQSNNPENPSQSEESNNNQQNGSVVVSGQSTAGNGWEAPPTPPSAPPQQPQAPPQPQDTTPPDVSIKSLTYDYPSATLKFEWISSESDAVFDVEYKTGDDDWNSLLANSDQTQTDLLASISDIVYSFRVQATDLAGNQSTWEEAVLKVRSGPSNINDLKVSYANNIFITLEWSAPYENGVATSRSYDIRYSDAPITEDNWDTAKPVSDFAFSQETPNVESPETIQTIDITPLKFNNTYYFAIKTFDGTNTSEVSNAVEYSTDSPPEMAKSPWPVFQRDAQSTGFVPYSGPDFVSSESVNIKRTTQIPNPLYTSLVMDANGILYGGGEKGLYAINSRNGEAKLLYDTYNYELKGGGVYYSAALASDNTIYFCSYGGTYLYALTPTGKLKWKYQIAGPNDGGSSPVIGSDGTIYVNSREQGYVYAINPDGTKKWDYFISGATSISSPVLGSDGTIYVSWHNIGFVGYVSAIDSEGNWRWTSENINPIVNNALSIDAEDNIYVGTNYAPNSGYLRSLKSTDGSLNWSFPGIGASAPAAIDINSNIYAVSQGGNVVFLKSDGTSSGGIYVGSGIWHPAVVDANGIIYVVSGKKIIAYYPDTTEKWSHEFDNEIVASPIIDDNGGLYITTTDGKLWALGD